MTHSQPELPPRPAPEEEHEDGEPHLLVLSACGPEALRELAESYAELLGKPGGPTLRQVCRAAARQREHHRLRAFVVADGREEAARQLWMLEPGPGRTARPPVAFVYTGMGPQWWGMGRELLLQEPVFARVVTACDEILADFGLSMARELLRDEAESRLTSTLYAQVANFVVQAGLTALWREWGIEPAVVTGHSVGEVAATYVAGVYSLRDALTISFHRASLQAGLVGRGAMAAVGLPAVALRAHLVPGAEVAAVNSTSATTLSGDPDAVAAVAEQVRATGVPVQALRVEVAFHSHHVDEIREPLLAALRGIRPQQTRIPLVSTVTGDLVSGNELDSGYWWRNVRQPVQFAAAFGEVLRFGPGAVVEIGPHPVLAPSMGEALAERGADVVRLASLNRRRPQRQQLLQTLGALYTVGADPDWEHVHPGPHEHLALPLSPGSESTTGPRHHRRGKQGCAPAPSSRARPSLGAPLAARQTASEMGPSPRFGGTVACAAVAVLNTKVSADSTGGLVRASDANSGEDEA